nr:alpha-2-macroglobulin homolog [Nerophis lumbriciformis]
MNRETHPAFRTRPSTIALPSLIRRGAWLALLIALFAGLPAAAAPELKIRAITPAGEDVSAERQIVIQFDRPMVPLGRMERDPSEVPIEITPALDCEWRWLNNAALSCRLKEKGSLVPATAYRMVITAEFTALDGARLAAPREHTFLTRRPRVERARFIGWEGPGSPTVQLTFDHPPDTTSVAEHVYFSYGDGERMAARVELRQPGMDAALERYRVLRPVEVLPLGSLVRLRVEPGLRSLRGPEPGAEDRVVVEFETFPSARFLGIRCRDNEGRDIGWGRADGACNPLEDVRLVFSSPMPVDVLRDYLQVEPDLAGGREDYDPWEKVYRYSRLQSVRRVGEVYEYHLPESLKARSTYLLSGAAEKLLDEFGRPLVRDMAAQFETSDRPPRFVLTHPISVLERQVETHVPVVVTNLEKLELSVRGITPRGSVEHALEVPVAEARNVAFAMPLRAREWLAGGSGALFGTTTSTPDSGTSAGYFFTQITPFAVHAKIGHHNSLVWVTDLASGLPVEGARVRIFAAAPDRLPAEPVARTVATTGPAGLALLDGTAKMDPKQDLDGYLNLPHYIGDEPLLWVRVDYQGEMALLPVDRDFTVRATGHGDSWIPSWKRRQYGHVRAWGTSAQGVYRVGDTLQYKIWVRDQDNLRFVPPPKVSYKLRIIDPTGKQVHKVDDVQLNAFGGLDGEFRVPESAAVGWYDFELSATELPGSLYPLRVLVADFTPAPFRVSSDLNGELFRAGDELEVATGARLHSGGPYLEAQTRVTVALATTSLPVAPEAQGFDFEVGSRSRRTLHQRAGTLDDRGDLTQTFTIPESEVVHGRLAIESAVRDDRGKYVVGRSSARYVGRDRFVGIRQPDWILQGGKLSEVLALVVDEQGQPVAGTEVETQIAYRQTTASRVKGAGNAYLTRYTHTWVAVDECRGVATVEPLSCHFKPDKAGLYRLTHSIYDRQGRRHSSSTRRWASGAGHVVWEVPPGHQMSIIPDRRDYRVGDTAKFLVQNPFPGARALITVERLGVQHSSTRVLEQSAEVIELPITADHLPGFYFSVVVTSPRVEAPLGEGQVDLGKPGFRMGYAKIEVRDPAKEIEVEVQPEQPLYRPRDKVKVELLATPRTAFSDDAVEPIELAVAVLDEAVFDLIADGSAYFDPYAGFYKLGELDLANYNLLTRLVGIQKFEKKGANPGGGGGSADLRSLFEFVSYWNPSIQADAEGRATIEFEVPDNLTGWRVLAMAVTPGDRMGLGEGHFAVNLPIELRPTLPNQVVEGDMFEAGFTVMNRTDTAQRLRLQAKVSGPAESKGLVDLEFDAAPYKRLPVSFPVRATSSGEIELSIEASGGGERDGLRLRLPVARRVALQTAATYGTTTDSKVTEQIAFPEGIRTDVGALSLVAGPSVIGGLDSAFGYLREYPYGCWEQRLTKAVMAMHFAQLRPYLAEGAAWPGHAELPASTLQQAANFQAPNGGMVYYLPEDRYVSPYLSAYTALAFGWLAEAGHALPPDVVERLDGYLERLLRRDVLPTFYSDGMASSVRAVALAALAERGKITAADLERYRRHLPQMDLFGKAHYLLAATKLGASTDDADEELEQEVYDAILSHADQTGGKAVFAEAVDTDFQRILHSTARTNCAVLSALVEQQGEAANGTGVGDLPFRLVRSISQERERRDRWENTQENVFCTRGLSAYSRVYESVEPRMRVAVKLGGEKLGKMRFTDLRDAQQQVERPIGTGDPGRQASLQIEKRGPGRLYYAARLAYSPSELERRSIDAGLVVNREYSVERDGKWQLLAEPMRIRRGELVRVDLYLSLPAARNFVVVDDPVPGGLEPVNTDLATASTVDAEKGAHMRSDASFWFTHDDWRGYGYSRWSFYYSELRHHAARFYSDYLPAGNYHLSYVAQAIAPGDFQVLPTHAEEMYDPDVFGQSMPAKLIVEGADQEAGQ